MDECRGKEARKDKYVEGCDLCQRIKNRIEEVVGKLKLSEVPEKP